MADNVNRKRKTDGFVPSEIAVSNVGAKERHHVTPERVECGNSRARSLAKAHGARLAPWVSSCRGAFGKRPLDHVGEDGDAAVVRKALAELNEADGNNAPWDLVGYAPKSMQLLLGWIIAIVRRSNIAAPS